jgi:ribosomal protein S18 acetylase RimI-like enzyme
MEVMMASLGIDLLRPDVDLIERVWRERWGLPICTLGRTFMPADVEGRALVQGSQMLGLVTWVVTAQEGEITSLDSFAEERGVGTRLVTVAEEAIRTAGATEAVVVVSNDNLHTLCFLLRRGYRLMSVHRDVIAEMRKVKPAIPAVGRAGIPIVDLWRLTKPLA